MMKKLTIFISILLLLALKVHSQDTLRSEGEIPIMGWWGVPAEEISIARFTEMKEAGFTINLTFLPGYTEYQEALDTAYAVGMKVMLPCRVWTGDPEYVTSHFKDHPALFGYWVWDEPPMNEFAVIGDWARRTQALDSIHPCYVNLNNNHANSSSLGTSSYRTYVNTFMNTVPLQFYSFDNYPFQGDSMWHTLRPKFYDNLEVFSSEAKKADKPFWAFAMSVAIKNVSYPDPTTAEMRLEMFSNLAYGAQGLQFFTYWTPPCGIECFSNGPIYNGIRMPVYYKVQEVCKDIKGLSCVFLGSKMVRVAHTGAIPQGTKKLNELPEQIKGFNTQGKGAVVSVLERDSLAFLAVVNRDYVDSMKLTIKGDSTVKRVMKDGALLPSAVSHIKAITIGPGDIAVFTWPKGDSIHFVPVRNELVNLPLDFDLKDYSGNGLNASDLGSVPITFVDDPERNRVASLAESSYLAFPDTTVLHFGSEDFSFALWVKIPSTGGAPVILSNKDFSNATEAGFSLYLDHADTPGSKQWGVNFADGSGNELNWHASDNGASGIADNQWHMVAVSFERNGMMSVSLDGETMAGSLDMSACPGNAYDASHKYRLTLQQDGTGSYQDKLLGFVDDLRFWTRALTSDEVAQIYALDTTGKSREIVYLPLDTDLKDTSGNGFDATDVGTVATTFVSDPERGQVAYFDRLSQAVLPKVDMLRFGTRDFAFSLWIKCSPASYTPLLVCNKDWSVIGANRKKGFAFYTNESNKSSGKKWSVNFGDGSVEEGGSGNDMRWYAADNSVPTIADNKWHFVAVSFDRDKTMDVYLDGDLMTGSEDMSALPGMAHDDVNDYPIMLMQDGPGKFWMDIPASMDEFRIWGRPLKELEIKSLYNYEKQVVTSVENSLSDISSQNLKVYPNPSNSEVNVIFNAEGYGETSVMVYNNTGVLVKSFSVSSQPGSNKTTFIVDGWMPGIYFVRVISEIDIQTTKILVIK